MQKALTEADGDMAKAEELLRVKLGTKAGKAAAASPPKAW
jgi:elongation factor Ts